MLSIINTIFNHISILFFSLSPQLWELFLFCNVNYFPLGTLSAFLNVLGAHASIPFSFL